MKTLKTVRTISVKSITKAALFLAIASAAYFPAANAQIIDYSVCGTNANFYRQFDQENLGKFMFVRDDPRYQEYVADYQKIADERISINNRMVSKGGGRWQTFLDNQSFKAFGKPKINPWSNGGKEYHYIYSADRTGFTLNCSTLTDRNGLPLLERHGAPKSAFKRYVWDEARYFIDSNGKVVGWLESLRGTQLCESAPTPCGLGESGTLTPEQRQGYERWARKNEEEMKTWIGAPIQERISTAKLKLISKSSDGNGGRVYEYALYHKEQGANEIDSDGVLRYFVGRDGIIYGYGGWLNYGEVAICAGGGNLGACGQGGRVLFKKNVNPQRLRRDGK